MTVLTSYVMWEVGGIERTRAQYFCSSQPSMVNLLSSFLRKGKSVWRLQEFEEEFQRSSEVTHAYRKVIGFERKAKGKRIGQQQAEEGWDESVQGAVSGNKAKQKSSGF